MIDDPDAPAAQALRHAARGLIAATPQERPVLQERSGEPRRACPRSPAPPCRWRPSRSRCLKYSAFISVNFVHSSGSWSSAKQASTGQASTQASQSMHSSGSM